MTTEREAQDLLLRLVDEVDFVTSGGDQPCDTCQECGLAGLRASGCLRDARTDALAYLRRVGRVPMEKRFSMAPSQPKHESEL